MAQPKTPRQRWERARESDWTVSDKRVLVLRRPLFVEYLKWNSEGGNLEVMRNSIVGWRGFIGIDFEGGTDQDPVQFDVDLAVGWMADRPEKLLEAMEHLVSLINARQEELKGDQGNSNAPSATSS